MLNKNFSIVILTVVLLAIISISAFTVNVKYNNYNKFDSGNYIGFESYSFEKKNNPEKFNKNMVGLEELVLKKHVNFKLNDFDDLEFKDDFGNKYKLMYWYYKNEEGWQVGEEIKWLVMVFGYSFESLDRKFDVISKENYESNHSLLCDLKICPGYKQVVTVGLMKKDEGFLINFDDIKFSEFFSSGSYGIPSQPKGFVLNANGDPLIEIEEDNHLNFGEYLTFTKFRSLILTANIKLYEELLEINSEKNAVDSKYIQADLTEKRIVKNDGDCLVDLDLGEEVRLGGEGDFYTNIEFLWNGYLFPKLHLFIYSVERSDGVCNVTISEKILPIVPDELNPKGFMSIL